MTRLLKADGIGRSGGPASHDEVTQALSGKASLVNGKVPVEQLPDGIGQADLKFFHGDDAWAERPDSSFIIWIGSVAPNNGVTGDQWINDTDPLAPTYHVHLAGAWRQIAGGAGGPDPEPPTAAPEGLTATAVSTSQINLSWNAVPGATSYEYRIGSGSAISVGSNTSAQVTGLEAGTVYSFQVRARNEDGVGPWSSVVVGSTEAEWETPPELDPDLDAMFPNEVTAEIMLVRAEVGGGDVVADVYLFDKQRRIVAPSVESAQLNGVNAQSIETVGVFDPARVWDNGEVYGFNVPFCYRFTWTDIAVGDYEIVVTATDGDELVDTDTRSITVAPPATHVVADIDSMKALDADVGDTIQVLDQPMGEDLFIVDDSGDEIDCGVCFALEADVASGSSEIVANTSSQSLEHGNLVMDTVRFHHRTNDYFEGWHLHGCTRRDYIDSSPWLDIASGSIRMRTDAFTKHANDHGDSVGSSVEVTYDYATNNRRVKRYLGNLQCTRPEWWGAVEGNATSGNVYEGHRVPWASIYTNNIATREGRILPLLFSKKYLWSTPVFIEDNVPWIGYGEGTGLLAPGENATMYWFRTVDDPNTIGQSDAPTITDWERQPHTKETALDIRTPYTVNKSFGCSISLTGIELDMNVLNNGGPWENRAEYGGSRAGFPMDAIQEIFRHHYEGKGIKQRTTVDPELLSLRDNALFRFIHVHDTANDNIGGQFDLDGSHDILTGCTVENHCWYGPNGVNLQNIHFYGFAWASIWSSGGVTANNVTYRSRGRARNPYRGWHTFTDTRDVEDSVYQTATNHNVYLSNVDVDLHDCVNTKGGDWSGDIASDRAVVFCELGARRTYTLNGARIEGSSSGTFNLFAKNRATGFVLRNVDLTAETTSMVFQNGTPNARFVVIDNLLATSRSGGSVDQIVRLSTRNQLGVVRHEISNVKTSGYNNIQSLVRTEHTGSDAEYGKQGLSAVYKNHESAHQLIRFSNYQDKASNLVFFDVIVPEPTELLLSTSRFRDCQYNTLLSDQVGETYVVTSEDAGSTTIDIPTSLFARANEVSAYTTLMNASVLNIDVLTNTGAPYHNTLSGENPILRITFDSPVTEGGQVVWTARVTPTWSFPVKGAPVHTDVPTQNKLVGEGDIYNVYAFVFDTGNVLSDTFSVTSSDTNVASVTQNENSFQVNYHEHGTANITITMTSDNGVATSVIPVVVGSDVPQKEGHITLPITFIE